RGGSGGGRVGARHRREPADQPDRERGDREPAPGRGEQGRGRRGGAHRDTPSIPRIRTPHIAPSTAPICITVKNTAACGSRPPVANSTAQVTNRIMIWMRRNVFL